MEKVFETGKTLSTVQDACDELKDAFIADFNTFQEESSKRTDWVNEIIKELSASHPGVVGMKMNSELIKKINTTKADMIKKGIH